MTVSGAAVARPSPRCVAKKSSAQAVPPASAEVPREALLLPSAASAATCPWPKAPADNSAATASTTA